MHRLVEPLAGRGKVAEASTGEILQERLTEYGLVRTLSRQDISPELIRVLSVDEAARLLQRGMLYPGSTHKTAKKVKKAKSAKKAKKAKSGDMFHRRVKKSAGKSTLKSASTGHAAVGQVQPNYWKRVKRELHILVCTSDKKYETLRRYIGRESKTTQIAMVSTISASIGACLGMAATVIGPFVTLALMALLQVGKNAWCAGQSI
jgi:hypothetical protein